MPALFTLPRRDNQGPTIERSVDEVVAEHQFGKVLPQGREEKIGIKPVECMITLSYHVPRSFEPHALPFSRRKNRSTTIMGRNDRESHSFANEFLFAFSSASDLESSLVVAMLIMRFLTWRSWLSCVNGREFTGSSLHLITRARKVFCRLRNAIH